MRNGAKLENLIDLTMHSPLPLTSPLSLAEFIYNDKGGLENEGKFEDHY